MIEGAEPYDCEKEPTLGARESNYNSGVLYAGLYYAHGSFKALLAVRGVRLMTAFAQRCNVPHEICGNIVVAMAESEVGRLRELAGAASRTASGDCRGLVRMRFATQSRTSDPWRPSTCAKRASPITVAPSRQMVGGSVACGRSAVLCWIARDIVQIQSARATRSTRSAFPVYSGSSRAIPG